MKLKGKTALITGAAKRVGRVIALRLAEAGCNVAITYLTSGKEAEATAAAIRRKGVKSIAVQADVKDRAQVKQAVRQVESHFGRIDVLVNNASSFYPTPLDTVTEEQWDDLIGSNLAGPWWFAQAVAPGMKRRRMGKIINIADVAAFSPWPTYLPYCAAKGGLISLTWGLAKALAPHIQVNAIAPGPILMPKQVSPAEKKKAIEKTLLKRSGSPEDIAQSILFLLQGSDFITGVVLPVDGGRRLA